MSDARELLKSALCFDLVFKANYDTDVTEEIVAELLDKIKSMEWQPIETLPLDNTIFDLMHKGGARVTDQWWVNEGCLSCDMSLDDFTHWMASPPVVIKGDKPKEE